MATDIKSNVCQNFHHRLLNTARTAAIDRGTRFYVFMDMVRTVKYTVVLSP